MWKWYERREEEERKRKEEWEWKWKWMICKKGRKENRGWGGEIYLMENIVYIKHCKNGYKIENYENKTGKL